VTLNRSKVRVEVWSRRMIEKGNQHSRVSKAAFVKNTKRAHIHIAIFGNQLSTQNLQHWIPSRSDKNETNDVDV